MVQTRSQTKKLQSIRKESEHKQRRKLLTVQRIKQINKGKNEKKKLKRWKESDGQASITTKKNRFKYMIACLEERYGKLGNDGDDIHKIRLCSKPNDIMSSIKSLNITDMKSLNVTNVDVLTANAVEYHGEPQSRCVHITENTNPHNLPVYIQANVEDILQFFQKSNLDKRISVYDVSYNCRRDIQLLMAQITTTAITDLNIDQVALIQRSHFSMNQLSNCMTSECIKCTFDIVAVLNEKVQSLCHFDAKKRNPLVMIVEYQLHKLLKSISNDYFTNILKQMTGVTNVSMESYSLTYKGNNTILIVLDNLNKQDDILLRLLAAWKTIEPFNQWKLMLLITQSKNIEKRNQNDKI